jgi:hypothetical protein
MDLFFVQAFADTCELRRFSLKLYILFPFNLSRWTPSNWSFNEWNGMAYVTYYTNEGV